MRVTGSTQHDVWDVVVVGAGFSGLYVAYRMREMGLTVRVLEQGSDVGGTWFWNRYPGARCDMFSYDYSYSFSPEVQEEWTWTERYGSGPEILRYIHFVADRFDLRRHVQLNTAVTAVTYDDGSSLWRTSTGAGDVLTSRFVVMATGVLSQPKAPDIDGMDEFRGQVLRSCLWPEGGVDLTGKRVGVIGTGSTGIQIIPALAPVVRELVVFQRSPNFSVPAVNGPVTPEEMALVRAHYDERRAESRLSS
jgi:cation diffusion facilitator CzcD-associated flavoprotein CzcO